MRNNLSSLIIKNLQSTINQNVISIKIGNNHVIKNGEIFKNYNEKIVTKHLRKNDNKNWSNLLSFSF